MAAGALQNAIANETGQYLFTTVLPGTYSLNHPLSDDPTLDLLRPASFGVLSTQPILTNNFYNARQIQLGLRVEF